jgi:hypothetical protein
MNSNRGNGGRVRIEDPPFDFLLTYLAKLATAAASLS